MHLWSVAQFQSSALGGFPVCCCTHPERVTGIEQLTRGAFRINDLLKFGFSEKATKFEKIFIRHSWQECRILCAQQCTCQKVDEDFSKQMWTSRIIQTLWNHFKKIINQMSKNLKVTENASVNLFRLIFTVSEMDFFFFFEKAKFFWKVNQKQKK